MKCQRNGTTLLVIRNIDLNVMPMTCCMPLRFRLKPNVLKMRDSNLETRHEQFPTPAPIKKLLNDQSLEPLSKNSLKAANLMHFRSSKQPKAMWTLSMLVLQSGNKQSGKSCQLLIARTAENITLGQIWMKSSFRSFYRNVPGTGQPRICSLILLIDSLDAHILIFLIIQCDQMIWVKSVRMPIFVSFGFFLTKKLIIFYI